MESYLKTATILYVEDEQDIREGYSRALKRYSKELFTAANGVEGLEKYKEYQPDIVVTDIKMPKMDGLSMINLIKEQNPNQIVIVTSAHSDTDYFLEAISLQVDGYLLKPVDKSTLKDKIEYFSKQLYLEKEIEQKNIILNQKEKLASMGEMITNIAHNWRQPLSIISTAATGMQIKKEIGDLSDDSFNEYLEIIVQNTDKLSTTIDEFSSFMSVESNMEKFNISSVVQKVITIESHAIDNLNVNVVLNIDEDLSITNFKNRFAQSLINILSNTFDVFDIKDIANRYLFIDLYKKDEQIVLDIKDNGGGIDDEIIDTLFEAYTTTKHQFVGTGLGLYTTYSILVNEMNCNIDAFNVEYEFNSKNYKGAQFKITLNNHG